MQKKGQVRKSPEKYLQDQLSILLSKDTERESDRGASTNLALASKLSKTIREYEELRLSFPAENTKAIDNLIASLHSQLAKFTENSSALYEDFQAKCTTGLLELFQYYLHRQQFVEKEAGAGGVKKITGTTFGRFCKDFGLIRENQKNNRKSSAIFKVFSKNSDTNKEMDEKQFLVAVEELSGVYLDEAYDQQHATEWRNLQPDTKKIRFFEIMGFSDPAVYNKSKTQSTPYKNSTMSIQYTSAGPSKVQISLDPISQSPKKISLLQVGTSLPALPTFSPSLTSPKQGRLTMQSLTKTDYSNTDEFGLKDILSTSSEDELISKYLTPSNSQKFNAFKRDFVNKKPLQQDLSK